MMRSKKHLKLCMMKSSSWQIISNRTQTEGGTNQEPN
jgi:hypothetical protein